MLPNFQNKASIPKYQKKRWHLTRNLRLPLILVFAVISLRLLSEQSANLSYLLIAAYALSGRAQAIQALALSWLVTMINPGIAPEASLGAIGRYLIMFSAAVSVFIRSKFFSHYRISAITSLTLGFGGFIILHSMSVSPMLDVSILKAIAWIIITTTIFVAWRGLSDTEHDNLSDLLFIGFVGVLIFSVPFLVLSQGYLRNASGFQGVLNHPQAFGAAIALLGAWASGRLLTAKRPSWPLLSIAALCLVMVVLSESRTAGVAMILSIAASMIILPLVSSKRATTLLPGLKSGRFKLVIFFAIAGSIALGPNLASILTDFIEKSGRAQVGSLIEAYELSRGAVIYSMTENITQAPWFGIGFGIASDPLLMSVVRDPLLGLPVGASIEKGVMPLAVLEELGILGFMLMVSWLWVLLIMCARGGVVPLTVFIAILLINLGESVFFSTGGMGLLQLILLGWAVSMGSKAKASRESAL